MERSDPPLGGKRKLGSKIKRKQRKGAMPASGCYFCPRPFKQTLMNNLRKILNISSLPYKLLCSIRSILF